MSSRPIRMKISSKWGYNSMVKRETLVEVKNLKQHFMISRKAVLKAVDGIDFTIGVGETLGLVGESGCGKSTTGKMLVNMYRPTEGQVRYRGADIASMTNVQKQEFKRQTQIIFQDPYSSLNPRMHVADIVAEGMDIHKLHSGKAREARIVELLDLVGLKKEAMYRYPHEFSGGQRQRIGIARAISLNPEFIVCDEPISALDVSIQAQIINLLNDLSNELNLTYLFISHDIKMVKLISHRIAVMYLGKIVEIGEAQAVFNNPKHPYSKALISTIPLPDPVIERAKPDFYISGEIPSPINRHAGCVFKTRCPYKQDKCDHEPPIVQLDNRQVACHFADKLDL